LQFGGGRQDSGNNSFDNGWWKGGSQDVLSGNVFSKIVSKVLMDKEVLSGHREEIFLFVLMVLGLVGSDVGEDVKTDNWGGRDGNTGDDVCRAIGDVEEGVIFWVVKNRPGKFRGGGTWDGSNR